MKKKQKAEPESRRKSSYKGNSRNNSKSGGLTFSEKKRLIQLKHILSGKSIEKEKPTTAQRTITFEKMFRDGICQVSHRYYTKMVEFFDINYELLEVDDQADILAQYSKLINYFDPSVRFELVLFNRQVNEQMLTEQFDIPWQEDDFNDIREEYTEMLKKQAAKGNNGIIKSKYLIFGVESNGYKEAKSRLNNIEKDVIRNLNNIGTLARGLDGKERLRILHEYFNQDTMEPFRFSFKDLAESGKSVKDYIAPPGFDFRYPNRFKSGNMYGCVSYLDIIAPKFTDELIKHLLDIDANLTISMHMQTEDPVKAIKKLKAVISNIQKMKIEEQKKEITGEPKNLEEQAISLVGRDIYEKLVKGYTEKQWGRDCKELPAFIIKRLPVRLTFDNNYFNALYQGIPIGGYTKIVENILDGIEVRLNTDYLEHKAELDALADKVVYTGPIDAYFGFKLGTLEYRSVRFENEILDIPNFQGNAAVNYTDRETPWTRIIEHKWFEFGKDEDGNDLPKTIISREYSSEWKAGDEPYYPVNDEKNGKLYAKYKELADKENGVIFGGRLGEYKYYDMDTTIASVLDMCEKELG